MELMSYFCFSCSNSSVKMLIVSVKGLLDLCDIVTSALSIIVSDLMNHDLGLSLIECCLKNLTYKQNLVSEHDPSVHCSFVFLLTKFQCLKSRYVCYSR